MSNLLLYFRKHAIVNNRPEVCGLFIRNRAVEDKLACCLIMLFNKGEAQTPIFRAFLPNKNTDWDPIIQTVEEVLVIGHLRFIAV